MGAHRTLPSFFCLQLCKCAALDGFECVLAAKAVRASAGKRTLSVQITLVSLHVDAMRELGAFLGAPGIALASSAPPLQMRIVHLLPMALCSRAHHFLTLLFPHVTKSTCHYTCNAFCKRYALFQSVSAENLRKFVRMETNPESEKS
jgi:hypothetical protein